MCASNLECFLRRTTPVVRSRFRRKNPHGQLMDNDMLEYFNLEELWDCFTEGSAYGVGSPIVMNHRETVVQYYTPYLSAIQIYYIGRSGSVSNSGSNCEAEFETESCSSKSEGVKLSRSSSSTSDKSWDVEDLGAGLVDSNRFGELYFEHFESDGPFRRLPLKNKVDALSWKYPGLMSFDSIDLSPASWVAIAWYPIYHIPESRDAKKISASFLTYHSLSLFHETGTEHQPGHGNMRLHPFGLATYRMQPRIWLDPETSDHERMSSLMTAANSWSKHLQVQHHDYNFFMSHSA